VSATYSYRQKERTTEDDHLDMRDIHHRAVAFHAIFSVPFFTGQGSEKKGDAQN
jgi:hypothetical protein